MLVSPKLFEVSPSNLKHALLQWWSMTKDGASSAILIKLRSKSVIGYSYHRFVLVDVLIRPDLGPMAGIFDIWGLCV